MSADSGRSRARAVADLGQGTIIATVEIAAPAERVFRALTTPEEILRWWGAEGVYQTTEWTIDLREGGAWDAAGRSADGSRFSVGGRVLEVDPPRKLVQTWKPDWDEGKETTVTYTLDPVEGGTRVTVRHEGFAGRPQSCRGHTSGWEQVLAWLDAHAATPQPAANKYFLCRLLPPRPSFASDMTRPEAEAMHRHAVYWRGLAARGTAIAFGPVADPKGAWGVGIVAVLDDGEVRDLQARDPAIEAGIGMKYETHPMPTVVVGSIS